MIAAIAAYFIKGLCGFANTLIFTTILSFGTANINISPIDLLTGYPANVILTWKNRKKLDSKIFLPLSALVLAGSIPGAFLLKSTNDHVIKLIFSIVVIGLGTEMLTREYSKKPARSSKAMLAIIGVLAGVISGLYGVSALLAAYVSRVTKDSSSFKANICAVFLVECTFRAILYSALHVITLETIKMSLLLLPAAMFALFIGMKCSLILNEAKIRKLTSVLLIFSGISLILKNL